MIDVTAADEISNDARARSNVVRLAAAQALTGANSAVIFATGSIVGATLAPDISLATVPLSMYVVGLAAGTLPTGAISRAYGRRVAFIIGTGCGVLTGLLGAFAILHASFALFCCATFLGGLYGAVSQSYRFAAADGASAAFRPKAVSWVMAGGVFAGVLGPQLVQWTMDIWPPYLFAFSFVVQAVVALVAMAVLVGRRCAEAGAGGSARRPSAVRDRAAAALHRGSAVRRHRLSHDESGHDLGAAGDEDVRPERQRFQFRHSVAYRGDVRTELLYGLADRALRRAQDRRARSRRSKPAGATIGLSGITAMHFWATLIVLGDRLEFRLRRRVRAGAGDAPAAGAQQGAGLQRFPGVRHDGGRIVLVRPVAGELRLVGGQHGGVSAGAAGARGAGAGVVREAAGDDCRRSANFPIPASDPDS